jgi:PAS domain S-box-containing protein
LCKSFESGAIDFISKPLNRFDLLARCQSALNLYNEKQQNLSQELELILREEKYRALFENSLDGILILNPLDLVVRDLNASAVSLFGFDSEDLIGKAFTSLCPKDSIPEIYKEVGALSDGNCLSLETQKVTANGKSLTVEIKFSSFLLQGEDRIMAVVSDVSKRLQSSEMIRLSEERLALAVLDKKNGIWDWDIAGGSIYFSDNWRKFFGISKNDMGNGMDF